MRLVAQVEYRIALSITCMQGRLPVIRAAKQGVFLWQIVQTELRHALELGRQGTQYAFMLRLKIFGMCDRATKMQMLENAFLVHLHHITDAGIGKHKLFVVEDLYQAGHSHPNGINNLGDYKEIWNVIGLISHKNRSRQAWHCKPMGTGEALFDHLVDSCYLYRVQVIIV